MEPNRRRAYTKSKRYVSRKKPKTKPSTIDTVVTQCIVCGLVLAFLLFVRVVDTPFSEDIRNSLKFVLLGETSVDEVVEAYSSVTKTAENMKNSVQTIFGGTKEEEEEKEEESTYNSTFEAEPENSLEINNNSNDNFRIDEDILSDINSRQDFYTAD